MTALPLPPLAAAPDPYDVTPGLLGFLVVLGIGLALWVLLRSMNRHLKRIDVPYDDRPRARRGLAARPGAAARPGGAGRSDAGTTGAPSGAEGTGPSGRVAEGPDGAATDAPAGRPPGSDLPRS